MKSYLKILKDILVNPEYSHFALFRKINNLKFEERKGWTSRDFKGKIEVVASHTLNAVYIASLLLPNRTEIYKGYDKIKILDMLLYHDLAECDIHDHLPDERNEIIRNKEQDFYEKLSLYRTYGFYNVKKIYELWNNFENNNNINSRIAKEIDKLEAYAQFLSYLDKGEETSIDDFKRWNKNVTDDIKTAFGKKIKKWIEKEFESVVSKYSI